MGHPSALKRREALTFATTWRDPENTSSVREADTEGHAGCDSTDGKCPEQTDPQTQRVDSWLSGTGKGVGVTGHGGGAFFGDGMFWI